MENLRLIISCIRENRYSPKAAKTTRAAKRRVMMEANLAMISFTVNFDVCLCSV